MCPPATYFAANQFHHKHADILGCDMFDVADTDIEFGTASGLQAAYCLFEPIGGHASQPTDTMVRCPGVSPRWQRNTVQRQHHVEHIALDWPTKRSTGSMQYGHVRICLDLRQCSSKVFDSYCHPIWQHCRN